MSLGVKGFRVDASKHMWPGDLENILVAHKIKSAFQNVNCKKKLPSREDWDPNPYLSMKSLIMELNPFILMNTSILERSQSLGVAVGLLASGTETSIA